MFSIKKFMAETGRSNVLESDGKSRALEFRGRPRNIVRSQAGRLLETTLLVHEFATMSSLSSRTTIRAYCKDMSCSVVCCDGQPPVVVGERAINHLKLEPFLLRNRPSQQSSPYSTCKDVGPKLATIFPYENATQKDGTFSKID